MTRSVTYTADHIGAFRLQHYDQKVALPDEFEQNLIVCDEDGSELIRFHKELLSQL